MLNLYSGRKDASNEDLRHGCHCVCARENATSSFIRAELIRCENYASWNFSLWDAHSEQLRGCLSEPLSTGTWMRLPEKLVFRWRSDEHERGASSWSCFLSRGGKSGPSLRPSPRYDPSSCRPSLLPPCRVCDSQFTIGSRKMGVKRGTYLPTSACYSRPFTCTRVFSAERNRPSLNADIELFRKRSVGDAWR